VLKEKKDYGCSGRISPHSKKDDKSLYREKSLG
jgi:hypothetical protein